jgi:uncharacterized membrane protein YdjX (TVP38/TMEM64 family)
MRWALFTIVLLAFILVPFVLFEDQLNALADVLLQQHGWYAAAAIVALLASDVFLPIPSSVVAATAGVLLGFWNGAAAVWVGMMASCVLGYAFGGKSSTTARRFVGDQGIARAADLAARYGNYAVAICRPIPVLAEASVIFAGVIHRPFGPFLLLTAWSNLGIALGYAAIGAYAMRVDSFLLAFIGAVAVPGLALLAGRFLLGRKQANDVRHRP